MSMADDTSGGAYFHALLTPEPAGAMTFVGQSPQYIANILAAYRVNTVCWFIQNDEFRLVDHCLRESKPLLHAL